MILKKKMKIKYLGKKLVRGNTDPFCKFANKIDRFCNISSYCNVFNLNVFSVSNDTFQKSAHIFLMTWFQFSAEKYRRF